MLETVRPIYGAGDESGEATVREDEEEEEEVLDEGAVKGPRHIRDIRIPSEAEVERYNLIHLPFRNWCPRCMRGRGKEAPRYRSKGGRVS